MYEPWVKDIDLTAVSALATVDPDHPNVTTLSLHATKRDRTGVAMIRIIQMEEVCIRQMFGDYVLDQSLQGALISLLFKRLLLIVFRSPSFHSTLVL